jgi:hypothetical protein
MLVIAVPVSADLLVAVPAEVPVVIAALADLPVAVPMLSLQLGVFVSVAPQAPVSPTLGEGRQRRESKANR